MKYIICLFAYCLLLMFANINWRFFHSYYIKTLVVQYTSKLDTQRSGILDSVWLVATLQGMLLAKNNCL